MTHGQAVVWQIQELQAHSPTDMEAARAAEGASEAASEPHSEQRDESAQATAQSIGAALRLAESTQEILTSRNSRDTRRGRWALSQQPDAEP